MDINKVIETRGIVISSQRYKETSRIINVFTEIRGKINIFANGVLRPTSGMMLTTEKFVESDFSLQLSKNNYYINSAKIINSNLELGNNPKSFLVGELICEALDLTMLENQIDTDLYNFISTSFKYLRKAEIDIDLLRLGFMIKYISHIGFKPHLSSCNLCNSKNASNMFFSNSNGGLVCGNCLDTNEDFVKVNKDEIEGLIKLLYSKYAAYADFKIEKDVLKKLNLLIYNYFIYNAELDRLNAQIKYEKLFGI